MPMEDCYLYSSIETKYSEESIIMIGLHPLAGLTQQSEIFIKSKPIDLYYYNYFIKRKVKIIFIVILLSLLEINHKLF